MGHLRLRLDVSNDELHLYVDSWGKKRDYVGRTYDELKPHIRTELERPVHIMGSARFYVDISEAAQGRLGHEYCARLKTAVEKMNKKVMAMDIGVPIIADMRADDMKPALDRLHKELDEKIEL